MNPDEQAIHNLVDRWIAATKTGDLATVLDLMTDDVIFMTPGREPFGKEAFAASSQQMKGIQFEGTSNIRELQILGDWAWMRNHLEIQVTPPGGKIVHRSGYTLTILRKKPDGQWAIARDANLVS
jgi:uncharacterized protein (TIGR02246 family)